MFEYLINRWKYRKEIKEFNDNPIIQAVIQQFIKEFENIPKDIKNNLDTGIKRKIFTDCLTDINDTLLGFDPIFTNRMKLAEAMLALAGLDVIFIKPNNSYLNVSGDLKQYIPLLKEKNRSIKDILYRAKILNNSIDEIILEIKFVHWKMKTYANAFNLVRIKLGDYDKNSDWVKPCYNSFLIWFEYNYRKKLDLPLSFLGDKAEEKALLHFNWFNLCHKEEKDIISLWSKNWKEQLNENNPYSL